MTAQKTARCKRALERLHRDIANYSQKTTRHWAVPPVLLGTAEERDSWFKDKLSKATACVAALNAKHVN